MRICAYRRVRVTAAVGLTEAGRVSGPAEGRMSDGSTRYMYRELQYARAESRGSEKVRMEARRPSGGHATRQQGISGEMGVPSLLQARLPFPRQRSYCIGATRQGFPNGSLCSALTGPVADAGQIPDTREWQAMVLLNIGTRRQTTVCGKIQGRKISLDKGRPSHGSPRRKPWENGDN